MARVCRSQMKMLLDLLSKDGVIVNGKVVYNNISYQNFWKRIALQLNAIKGGAYKSSLKWCKTWADWKNKTKKKANLLLRIKNYNLLCSTPTLTDMELRLLNMIDYPIDGKTDVFKLEEVNIIKMTELDSGTAQLEYFGEDYNIIQNEEKMFNSKESIDIYNDKSKTEYCYITDACNDNEKSFSNKEKVKIKGKLYKNQKISLEEYKIKTSLEIEKERVQQKSEELRLRALELKLKGEELRLKEIEMNKINYLTNIEEEKLKCFKDISTSLKELLEKNKIGNLHFNTPL